MNDPQIADGALYARISQSNGMVHFNEAPDEYCTAAMIKALDSKIQEVVTLSDKLKAKEKEVVCSVKYIAKTTPGTCHNSSYLCEC